MKIAPFTLLTSPDGVFMYDTHQSWLETFTLDSMLVYFTHSLNLEMQKIGCLKKNKIKR